MIKKILRRDNIWFGMFIGLLIPVLAFLLFNYANSLALKHYNVDQIVKPVAIQLFAMCTNLPLFRLYMLKWDMEQSGKGMLMATFLLAFVYIFLHRQQLL